MMLVDRTDYSAVVKNRAPLPNSWKWEIYRAGRSSPIKQSLVYFQSMVAANSAGKEALKQLLDQLCAEPSERPFEPAINHLGDNYPDEPVTTGSSQ
jgi:hypothetical protein